MNGRGCVAGLALAVASVVALAQPGPAPYAPRFERPIVTAAAGPQRLPIDVPLLAGAAPFVDVRGTGNPRVVPPRAYGGLSDLRLFGPDGREIGYLLLYGGPRGGPPPADAPMSTPLAFERRPSEPGRSRYRVGLPHAPLPIVALVLDVGGEHVFRAAFVTEPRLAGGEAAPAEIGRATLSRVAQGGATAGPLLIPVLPPREPELDLVVEDGNNPPLDLRGVGAVFAELPWIYFEAPAGPVVARYGDTRALAPLYDLEAARSSIRVAEVPVARWGDPRVIGPAGSGVPATVVDTGAPVDASAFRVQRSLPSGKPGLVALSIDAAVLAGSRGPAARFADVRIVDGTGRQVPYLLERREEPLTLELDVKSIAPKARELRPGPGRQRSVYAVRLPYTNLPPVRLVLETTARVFQRSVQVGVERPPDRRRREAWFDVLASSAWQHADASTASPALTLEVDAARDPDLVIVLDEGDNRPLPITAARALLPSYRLRFYQPPGPTRLLYGRDDLGVPQYDLELLGAHVMGAAAREISPAPLVPAPPGPSTDLVSRRTFWIGLGVAVVVLVGLIARLVKR